MTQTLTIEIDGMSCAACAGRAERALAALPGMRAVTVNFAARTARLEGEHVATDRIAQALGSAGYSARVSEVELDVGGLSCASCVNRVETALTAVPGVLSASVNLATRRALVRHLSGVTNPEALAAAVTAAGYSAEPRSAETETQSDRYATEIAETRRAMLIAGGLTLPVFVMEMGGHLFPALHGLIHDTIGMTLAWQVQFVLTTLVLIWPGRVFFRLGLPALLRGAPEMNSLVALGTLAAWGYSTVALFLPGLLPQAARAVYFEAAAVIVTLILLGRWMEARARGRTGAAIERLIGLQPETVEIERGARTETLPLAQVRVGDIIRTGPGARIAVDGTVIDGQSYVDESMITGEPVPVDKSAGSEVVGGTINGTGGLRIRAEAVGQGTVLARIVAMVEEAQGAKLPIQALADRVVRVFVPAVIAVAALTVALWLLLGPDPALSHALVAGVSVLIIACPCAMGLATPTSIMVGTGRAAELGVLFRKGDALQGLEGARVVAFDKTGTLTEGRPEVARIALAEGAEEGEVLRLAAAVEARSEHPLAAAILRAAGGDDLPGAQQVQARAGHGISARVDGRQVVVGNLRMMQGEGIDTDALKGAAEEMSAEGQTLMYVSVSGELRAVIGVADQLKPSAARVISALRADGLRTAMITGDTEAAARAVAETLGIDRVVAGVLPDGKRDAVRGLRDEFGPVAFVGDGINDAPALAEADLGLAVGTGTDVAIGAADVVLISGDLGGVLTARHVSARTMRNIRQNLFWAFGYNAALIPVAAGLLYPLTGTLLSPMLAAGAMALSSVCVVGNALRLRGIRRPPAAKGETA